MTLEEATVWLSLHDAWLIDRTGPRWTLKLWTTFSGKNSAKQREFIVEGEHDCAQALTGLASLAMLELEGAR